MYKDILARLNKINDLSTILYYYSGNLFQLKENDLSFDLIFNRQYSSPVVIPKLDPESIVLSPKFYLDDDNIFLTIDKVLLLVVMDRLESFRKGAFKLRNHRMLTKDIRFVLKSIDSIQPTSFNNKLKLEHRVRIFKTYELNKKNEKVYFDPVGLGLWDSKIPNTENDINKYASIFNDPIAVASLSDGVYCSLGDESYRGPGYYSDDKKIVSIYETKTSLPERLRIQYTSSFLAPEKPEKDFLLGDIEPDEKTNAITVFLPAVPENNSEGNDLPFGKWTLLTGEVIVNKELASHKYYVRRTFTTSTLDVNIIEKGITIQPGQILAYDSEDRPVLVYDLNYENAVVEDVIKMWNCYKIVVKVCSPLGVARIVSETGLKGVTHPHEDLGYIELPENFSNRKHSVQMVVGPNAMKSGSNGVKLAWVNLAAGSVNESISIDPAVYSSEEIDTLYADNITKVDWYYKGKVYKVYAGLISFGVTDLAKDCKSNEVRIMPETLKYMYLSDNNNLTYVADKLLSSFISQDKKWALNQLLKLRTSNKLDDDNVPVYQWNDPSLQKYLANSVFNTANWTNNPQGLSNTNMLLNPLNNGFYIQFFDIYIRFPSNDIINYLSYVGQGTISYPLFLTHAIFLLMSIKAYFNNKATIEQVLSNHRNYVVYVDDEIFSKKAMLSSCVSPIVSGGNLKQLVSPLVPRGTTVILDGKLEYKISQFYKSYKRQIWEIGVRNPVIWRFQFIPRRVWTFNRFVKHLEKKNIDIKDVLLSDGIDGAVLRNTVDVMFDRADTDGDLYPVAIPMDYDIQDALNQYMKNPIRLKEYEKKWVFEYIDAELSKNEKFIDIENKPFKFHEITREQFSEFLASSAIAKAKVGVATVDLWKFHSAAEWLYIDKVITKDQLDYQMFLFSSLVQTTVIEGIKHVDGGSSGYDIFMLSGVKENAEIIKTALINSMGIDEQMADLFITISLFANDNDYSKAISRLPNGGISKYISKIATNLNNIPSEYKNTSSYCRILKPYWDNIVQVMNTPVEENEEIVFN